MLSRNKPLTRTCASSPMTRAQWRARKWSGCPSLRYRMTGSCHRRPTRRRKRLAHCRLSSRASAEPEFKIRCLDGEGNEVKKFEIEVMRYVPLTEDQVSGL